MESASQRGATVLIGGVATLVTLSLLALPGATGRSEPRPSESSVPALASPFADTPAESFAVGAEGVELPAARALPGARLAGHQPRYETVTAEEIADAVGRVREALIATRIDRAMLVDHDPDPYIATQAALLREQWAAENWPAAQRFTLPEYAVRWATKLHPDATLTSSPRVAGEISYRAATAEWGPAGRPANRVVEVVTRFVWVYALDAPGRAGGLVVIRDEQIWLWPADYRIEGIPQNHGIHHAVGSSKVAAWGVDCGAWTDGLILPGKPINFAELAGVAFDPTAGFPTEAGC